MTDAARALAAGMSPWLALLGVLGVGILMVIGVRHARGNKPHAAEKRSFELNSAATVAWLVVAPAAAVMAQFVLLAAGKPTEYARFGMLPAVSLLLLAAWAGSILATGKAIRRQLFSAVLVVAPLPYGLAYCRAFVRDSRPMTSRLKAAEELPVTGRILLESEPAPYSCPPVNLFSRDLVLLPAGAAKDPDAYMRQGDLLLYPVDVPLANAESGPRRLPFGEAPGSLDQFTTPITWADKTFALQTAK